MFNSYHYSLNSMLSFTVRQHFTTLFNSCIHQLPVHKDGFLQVDLIDFSAVSCKNCRRYASPTEILTLPETIPLAFFYMEQKLLLFCPWQLSDAYKEKLLILR